MKPVYKIGATLSPLLQVKGNSQETYIQIPYEGSLVLPP